MEPDRLLERLRELGVADAEGVAEAFVRGDRQALAEALVLHSIWVETIDSWRDDTPRRLEETRRIADGEPFSDAARALDRLLAAGADEAALGAFARAVAYAAAFDTFTALAGDFPDPDVDDVSQLAGDEAFECLGDLHESLLSADPSGREGRPST